MRIQNRIAALCLLMTTSLALAEHHEGKGEHFDKRKAMVLENIDARLASLNTMKTCVSGAADVKAIKDCRKAHRSEMQGMKEKMRAEMKNMKGMKKK